MLCGDQWVLTISLWWLWASIQVYEVAYMGFSEILVTPQIPRYMIVSYHFQIYKGQFPATPSFGQTQGTIWLWIFHSTGLVFHKETNGVLMGCDDLKLSWTGEHLPCIAQVLRGKCWGASAEGVGCSRFTDVRVKPLWKFSTWLKTRREAQILAGFLQRHFVHFHSIFSCRLTKRTAQSRFYWAVVDRSCQTVFERWH